jgi:hypothetical protein
MRALEDPALGVAATVAAGGRGGERVQYVYAAPPAGRCGDAGGQGRGLVRGCIFGSLATVGLAAQHHSPPENPGGVSVGGVGGG